MKTSTISSAQPEHILKSLGNLRSSIVKEQDGQPTVLLTCAMTLIVATDESDEGRFASSALSELMSVHPNRSIVLAFSSEESDEDSRARLHTQFGVPVGTVQQIGCEQIELKVGSEDWSGVASILMGLIAGDLPVVLWCRYGAAMKSPLAQSLNTGLGTVMDLATKSIVDTQDCPTNVAFLWLAKWRENNRVMSDLEWTRLSPWREPIAHMFDNPARLNRLSAFHALEIAYTDEKPTLASIYMGAWLSAPYRANVSFKRAEGYGPGVHAITMHSADETIVLERTGEECIRLSSTNGHKWQTHYSDRSITALLAEELSLNGPDPAFDAAFARAQELLSEC